MKPNCMFSGMLAGLILFGGCSGSPPTDLTLVDGKLPPCPSRPNCVSSQATEESHAIEPIAFDTDAESAFRQLKAIINAMPRAAIVRETEHQLQVEFKTRWMGFVDDALFWVDEAAKVIHVRSASRVGYSDLGVNRKRIEFIRKEMS